MSAWPGGVSLDDLLRQIYLSEGRDPQSAVAATAAAASSGVLPQLEAGAAHQQHLLHQRALAAALAKGAQGPFPCSCRDCRKDRRKVPSEQNIASRPDLLAVQGGDAVVVKANASALLMAGGAGGGGGEKEELSARRVTKWEVERRFEGEAAWAPVPIGSGVWKKGSHLLDGVTVSLDGVFADVLVQVRVRVWCGKESSPWSAVAEIHVPLSESRRAEGERQALERQAKMEQLQAELEEKLAVERELAERARVVREAYEEAARRRLELEKEEAEVNRRLAEHRRLEKERAEREEAVAGCLAKLEALLSGGMAVAASRIEDELLVLEFLGVDNPELVSRARARIDALKAAKAAATVSRLTERQRRKIEKDVEEAVEAGELQGLERAVAAARKVGLDECCAEADRLIARLQKEHQVGVELDQAAAARDAAALARVISEAKEAGISVPSNYKKILRELDEEGRRERQASSSPQATAVTPSPESPPGLSLRRDNAHSLSGGRLGGCNSDTDNQNNQTLAHTPSPSFFASLFCDAGSGGPGLPPITPGELDSSLPSSFAFFGSHVLGQPKATRPSLSQSRFVNCIDDAADCSNSSPGPSDSLFDKSRWNIPVELGGLNPSAPVFTPSFF